MQERSNVGMKFRIFGPEVGAGERRIFVDGHLSSEFCVVQAARIAKGASTIRPTSPLGGLCSIATMAPSRRSRLL